MTIYNILFPFLILIALGIAIYILTKHLPEAVEQHEILDKEEKKRWWQVLLGKGENILRSLRVLLLKLDNRLNVSIKKVRERKEEMGKGLKEYRSRNKNKAPQENIPVEKSDEQRIDGPEPVDIKRSFWESESLNEIDIEDSDEMESSKIEEIDKAEQSKNRLGGLAKKVTSVLHPSHFKKAVPTKSKTVEEILKKTFTPTELKVEKEQYWKKKEEMLIQSIVREPKNVGLYLQLGRLYSNQHNWKDARNAFLEVIKLDKTNVKAKEELKRIDKNLNE